MNPIDCAIIGAGPAGLSAAIQAKREGMSVVVFESARPGGQALSANWIENYPGFPEGISGAELMQRFIRQAAQHGVEIRNERVISVDALDQGFDIRTDLSAIECKTVIVASGLKPKKLGIAGEEMLIGKSLFYYPDPQAIAHEGKDVLVIGGGDAAFDQALNFSRKASSVSIAMKSDIPRCAPRLAMAAREAGLGLMPNLDVVSLDNDGGGIIATFEESKGGSKRMRADFLVACIGKRQEFDFLNVDRENSDRIFFAGDCKRKIDRHIAIAVGDGIAEAMAAKEYLWK